MAIEGLYVRPEQSPMTIMRSGAPDVAEAVGVTIEAHKELGFAPDEDQASESLTREFGALAELGYDGRLYVDPPTEVKTDDIIEAADGKRPGGVGKAYLYQPLWVPGTEDNSYTAAEINAGPHPQEPEARLAVFSARTDTGVDPVLHFTGLPFDDASRGGATRTQVKALEEAKQQFVEDHPDNQLHALGQRAVTMMVLMDRIRGVDPGSDEFILNDGWMCVPDLGRRGVDGGSVVGEVSLAGGGLKFVASDGGAGGEVGVGLSVGPKEA